MASNHHQDEIFKEKRKPKNPIKFQVQLNEEQKETKGIILANDITVITGQAGSGKTLVAVQTALDLLFNKEVEKIIIARPVVTAKEEIGFLPGGIKEKLDPFVAPIYDNAYRVYDKEKVDMYFERGQIEIVPFAFMRGRNFSNAFIIVDEAQNVTDPQMEMVISRLCKGSKMVIVGDTSQVDLRNKKDSGMYFLSKQVAGSIPGVASVILKTNHRHPIVESVLNMYKEHS
jgi:phosphate starvation-inducible protein PhoH and related proteins